MRQILVIAKQTFKETVRNKILFIFIILSLITICCSVFMPVVGDGREKIKIVESMCFRSITFFGTLAAILLSASSIPTDIENNVLCSVTTKPVPRINIVLGKITGFIYIIGVLLLIMGSVSYVLIRFTAVNQGDQGRNALQTREKYDPYVIQTTGKSTKKIGNLSWIEGGGNGTSVWKFKGLNSKEKQDNLEIRTNFLIESKKRYAGGIPIIIKVINPYSGEVLAETIDVSRNKPVSLRLDGQFVDGSKKLEIDVSPENSGDFIGICKDSITVFFGEKSFGANYLKGLAIFVSQFLLMVIIAISGSTFLSLPVNILFCLFVFFCGNITDLMRDLSTVVNVFQTSEQEHGISTVLKRTNVSVLYLNYIIKKPILLLSYILPDFRYFNVGNYFIDGINIPYKKVFMGFGYTALYSCFCLPISFLVFKRREFA
ncbi:MAG: ABC transporter permease [Planctomycetota bacterium]|jgi:ABC-type transport system involved in multi-copper enzyme maturation permease subunit